MTPYSYLIVIFMTPYSSALTILIQAISLGLQDSIKNSNQTNRQETT